ncbi:MAG: FAD-dependent oxidoreductase [Bacteroidota bacterium]
MQLLIIGGSDAGISAALRAKELAPTVQVTMILADEYPNFSICGIPFYLSGEVSDWRNLAHRTEADIKAAGIEVIKNERAIKIDPIEKEVTTINSVSNRNRYSYDKLIIGTGAKSVRPPITGLELDGVFTLRWIGEMLRINEYIQSHGVRSAVIVGGGYIGLEMADALTLRGVKTTLIEFAPNVLTTVDPPFGDQVEKLLRGHGISILTNTKVESIERIGTQLRLSGTRNLSKQADLVLVCVGAQPETTLAMEAGVELGARSAIKTNRYQGTNIPDVYAAGDCAETWHQLAKQFTYLPLGTTAHKQGRIAGENAVRGRRQFQGSLGTQSIKLFDTVIARTGLHDRDAERFGIQSFTHASTFDDHKAYYPGATKIHLRLTGEVASGRLLGVQIMGKVTAEISKRIDIAATAIFNELTIEQLSDLDLSYTPPLSSPWDPLQMAAQKAWEAHNALKN